MRWRRRRTEPVYLVAYPKSGSTWLRFILGNYRATEPCDFQSVRSRVPDIHDTEIDPACMQRAAVLKSHLAYQPAYSRVLLMVRDPRDVAVSYYYHHLKHGLVAPDLDLDGFVSLFNAGELYPAVSWRDHTDSWLSAKVQELRVLRYEDMHNDTEDTLHGLLDFLGLERDTGALRQAIRASDFSAMRRLEEAQHEQIPSLRATREDIRHVRSGKVGGWRGHLSESAHDALWQHNRSCMQRLGYGRVTPPLFGTAEP